MENGKRELSGSHTPRHSEQRPRRNTGRKGFGVGFIIGTILLIGILTCLMFAGLFMMYVKTTLSPTLNVNAEDYTMNQSSIIYYQDRETGEWVEFQTLHGEENRILVKFEDLPEYLWKATVAIEDQRFFEHKGVDWQRTVTATANMFLKAKTPTAGPPSPSSC